MDLDIIIFHCSRLVIAFGLALPIAWDRELEERSLGLRTFPLVAMASTGYLLLGLSIFQDSPSAQARLFQGLMTGIGFLGGGAIVKRGLNVHGTATAASIWNTAAVGAAIAYDRFEIALLLSLVNFTVLRLLGAAKEQINGDAEKDEDDSDSGD